MGLGLATVVEYENESTSAHVFKMAAMASSWGYRRALMFVLMAGIYEDLSTEDQRGRHDMRSQGHADHKLTGQHEMVSITLGHRRNVAELDRIITAT